MLAAAHNPCAAMHVTMCVGWCCVLQVNHLGPYTLTRLLEAKLVASKARVVMVVSVTHRITTIK